MPHQTFLIEGCDPVDTWHWLPWKGPGHPHHIFSASSRTWALPWSLALLICSSSRPWAESHGSSGSSFFFGLFSALFSESVNFALVFLYNFSVPCSVFYDCRNGSEVSAAQLLCGSQVSSASEDPFHFRKFSTLPSPLDDREMFTSRILLPHPLGPPPLSCFVSFPMPASFLV